MRRAARPSAPMLDLKRDHRCAINAQAELRSDGVAARVRRQERDALWRQALDVYAVEQRFPLHLAGRAVEDNHSAVILAVLEVAQLAQQVFERLQVADARPAEV